jgi:hypothetical protein
LEFEFNKILWSGESAAIYAWSGTRSLAFLSVIVAFTKYPSGIIAVATGAPVVLSLNEN